MINGVAILFGLFAMAIISIIGGWAILILAHLFIRKYHELHDYLEVRKVTKGR